MKPGTPQHRDLLCSALVETHAPFEPEHLPWPVLDPVSQLRFRGFTRWGDALARRPRLGDAPGPGVEGPPARRAA
jgi:hypothetical protein